MLCDVDVIRVFINAWNAKIIKEDGWKSSSCLEARI